MPGDSVSSEELNSAKLRAIESIAQKDIRKHINFLASDALEGREAGSDGSRAASVYLEEKYEQFGLKPAGDNGRYTQFFNNGYRNILGMLPGSDPDLRGEIIVLGAHFDHVGYGFSGNSRGAAGQIHNGADDNASGVATLLEIVEAFHTAGIKPRHSILFALWDGEELGLLGSKHWVAVPTLNLNAVKFYINLDMVGRLSNNRLEVYGSRTASGLQRLYAETNLEKVGADFNWNLIPDSDHYSFLSHQIPFMMPFTGKHDDYHRPSDDAHLINYPATERIARHWFRLLLTLDELDQLPAFRPDCLQEYEDLRRQWEANRSRSASRLGIAWSSSESDEAKQLIVREVRPDSAAWLAGIRVGDVLVGINGIPFETSKGFTDQIMVASKDSVLQRAKADLADDQSPEIEDVPVKLYGSPVRIGLGWRVDQADPRMLIVNRLVANSPAVVAGLKYNDRLLAINETPIESSQQARGLIDAVEKPFLLDYERNGIVNRVELTPLKILSRKSTANNSGKLDTELAE